jgi:carbonic anhydrase
MHESQSRRAFLGHSLLLGGSALAAGPFVAGGALAWADAGPNRLTAPPANGDAALKQLLAGNRRFVRGKLQHPGRDAVRRVEIAEGQKPFAMVLGCADSRVPPEVVFDQGLGDMFVVRIAGNTANEPAVVGSLEYSATTFGSVLLMVLGHDDCGAVKAAIDVVTKGATLPGEIPAFVEPIIPAVEEVQDSPPGALLDRAIKANITDTVTQLKTVDSLLTDLVNSGKVKVVGGEYKLKTGKVEMVVQ